MPKRKSPRREQWTGALIRVHNRRYRIEEMTPVHPGKDRDDRSLSIDNDYLKVPGVIRTLHPQTTLRSGFFIGVHMSSESAALRCWHCGAQLRICPECRKPFPVSDPRQKFCSRSHKLRFYRRKNNAPQ